MDLLRFDSFLDLIAHAGIKTRSSKNRIEAIETVDLLEAICHLGDRAIALSREGRMPRDRAEELLADLMACFAEPTRQARRVIEIRRALRKYDV